LTPSKGKVDISDGRLTPKQSENLQHCATASTQRNSMAWKYVYPKDESSALDIGLVEASGREPILKISNCAAS
jgi:hypothetical protein